jgi:hypothetical protein
VSDEFAQHEKTSKAMLKELDRLDEEIKTSKNKPLRRKLSRDREQICRQFALHLKNDPRPQISGWGVQYVTFSDWGREVVPHRKVEGVPSKKRKDEARTWMAGRQPDWDGSAEQLRSEVRKALDEGAEVPNHHFGLHCDWTVRIREFPFKWQICEGRNSFSAVLVPAGRVRYR